jgi:hypothetical protein
MNAMSPKTGPIAEVRIHRPSVLRYQRMVQALVAADHALQDGEHPLDASIRALHAVMVFLGDDSELRNVGISVALRRLLASLNDTAHGAKSDLLSKIDDPTRGAPEHRSEDYLRGIVVAAVCELIRARFKNQEAAKMIARMASDAGLRHKGKPIPYKQILQWREQVGDTSPKATDLMAGQVSALLAQGRSNLPDTKQTALKVASMLITAARRNSN